MRKNEELICILNDISLLEPRTVRSGIYGGPSFRIARGMYVRLGAFRSESHEEIQQVDKGTLVLTNKRLVFLGSKRTLEIDLRKILSMEPYSDALGVRISGKTRTIYFSGMDKTKFTLTFTDQWGTRTYEEPFTGLVLMCAIKGMIKQIE